MNLAKNPTKDQLKEILSEVDDKSEHHIMWVDDAGEVRIDPMPVGEGVFEQFVRQTKFRFEVWGPGKGYTGIKAAKDAKYVDRLFAQLTDAWAKNVRGPLP